jgi:ectoine hydroxylase-related dioxygenase (phytanoyl-CoA dioxygenase family)
MQTEDLAQLNDPLTDTFLDPADGREISSDQQAFFAANGYVAGVRLLTDDQVAALRCDLAEMMQPEFARDPRFYEYHLNESTDSERVLFHALGAWRVSPAFHDLLLCRTLVSAAEKLLGGKVRLWHDQVFVKPANDGAVVAWHQDYSYWTRTKPVAHLTCWIALDDSTIENGCVHYVPGSHRWNLLPRGDLANDMNAVLDLLDDGQRAAFKPVAIELKAGEASFHHSMTLHGSYENRSARPRRAAVINFFRDGVLSDTNEPLLDSVPVIPKGRKIDGRFFPSLSQLSKTS